VIMQLAASILYNTVLTKLDLHYNDITSFGCTALAHVLKANTTLICLDLSYNGIYTTFM
jgi:Leucine-rich repeat (LRR) protein